MRSPTVAQKIYAKSQEFLCKHVMYAVSNRGECDILLEYVFVVSAPYYNRFLRMYFRMYVHIYMYMYMKTNMYMHMYMHM